MNVDLCPDAVELLFRDVEREVDGRLRRLDRCREHERERPPWNHLGLSEALLGRQHCHLREIGHETERSPHVGLRRVECLGDREQDDTRRSTDAELPRQRLHQELRFERARTPEGSRDERRTPCARRGRAEPFHHRLHVRERQGFFGRSCALGDQLLGRGAEISETPRGLDDERVVGLAEPSGEGSRERAPSHAEAREIAEGHAHRGAKLVHAGRSGRLERSGDGGHLGVAGARAPRRVERLAQSSELHPAGVYGAPWPKRRFPIRSPKAPRACATP